MLNSAGSVSAEWYIETLWHYLNKRKLLQGVRSFDVEFKQPARLADQQLHFSLPHPERDGLVMDFHVLRAGTAGKKRSPGPGRAHRHPPRIAPPPARRSTGAAGVTPTASRSANGT